MPWVVADWHKCNPDTEMTDQQVRVQPRPASPKDKRRDHTIFYEYRAGRARRSLHGIDAQFTKAQQAIAGKTPIKRNRFVQISGGTKELNQALIDRTTALAGLKG